MNKFLIASAIALAIGAGTSTKAQAQIVYDYSMPAFGGVETSGLSLTSYGPQSYKDFYSPLTGYMSVSSGNLNTLYSRGTYTNIYSPFTGYMTESRGTMLTPFGLASYLSYNSPYTGPVTQTRLANSASANNTNLVNFNNVVPFGFNHHWWNNGNGNMNSNGRHR
jgi:hypothetical protein